MDSKNKDNQIMLEIILDVLCKATNTDLFMILPKEEKERIPYLKKEIKNVLEKVEYAKQI